MKEQKEEKEISISNLEEFSKIAGFLEKRYGIKICFVHIFGNRWSYIAGNREGIFSSFPERIKLSKNLGVIVSKWHQLDEKNKREIIEFLKNKLSK